MSRMPLTVAVGLLIVAVCGPETSALAQVPARVRVVNGPARIQRWFRPPLTEVLLEVESGTTLEVLDKEQDWFWVILPPTAHGTRRAGWIRAGEVEPVTVPAAAVNSQPESLTGATSASVARATIAEDKVTITAKRDQAASSPAKAPAVTRAYRFEDVHFDRDRSSLRREDMDLLRAAVTALRADPSLVVNIEGYTCNLGSTAYNLALGLRRAEAVKDYLVSEGIAAGRLHTVSLGEARATHDNSREETRQLNRRVALVPDPEP